nr:hypothetical protein [Xanthomonas arboricola]
MRRSLQGCHHRGFGASFSRDMTACGQRDRADPGVTMSNDAASRCAAVLAAMLFTGSAIAADPTPELKARPPGTAQAVGAVHTLRQIPEACARLEGVFTGNAAQPYTFSVVRSSPTCQPRARFVDYAKATPSVASGWIFNDVIRVPSAACPSQQAVVRVWRKPVDAKPQLDGQGQSRIYLEDAKQQAAAGKIPQVPMFAAQMAVEGKACQ